MIEGLGQHGMVGSADQSLINLHDGLRQEFTTVREQYQLAIDKLEHLALASKDPLTNSSGIKLIWEVQIKSLYPAKNFIEHCLKTYAIFHF